MESDTNTFRGRLLENWTVIVAIFYICITIFGWLFSYIIYYDIKVFPFHFFDLNDFLLSGFKLPQTIISAIALTAAICSKVFFEDLIEVNCKKYLFWSLVGIAVFSFLFMVAATRGQRDEISYICIDSQRGPATIIAIAQISNNFLFARKMDNNYSRTSPQQTLIFNRVKIKSITLPLTDIASLYPKNISCDGSSSEVVESKPE